MTTDSKDETTSDLEIRWPEPKWVARGQGAAMNPARVNQLAAAMRQELVVGEWLQLVIELFGDDEDEMLGGLFTQAAWEKLGLLYKFGGSDPRSAGWNAAVDAAREMLASSYKAGPPAEGADRPGDEWAIAGDAEAPPAGSLPVIEVAPLAWTERQSEVWGGTIHVTPPGSFVTARIVPGSCKDGDCWVLLSHGAASEHPTVEAAKMACDARNQAHIARQVSVRMVGVSDIPLAPSQDAGTGLRNAVRQILPYLDFTIGPESPGHHPSLPSAIDRLRAELEAEEGRR